MPENPNADPDVGSTGMYLREQTMATVSSTNSQNNVNTRKQQQSVPRVSSATLKYYDIATQLLGKAGSDLVELFIAAARVSMLCVFGSVKNLDKKEKKTLGFVQKFFAGILLKYWKIITRPLT